MRDGILPRRRAWKPASPIGLAALLAGVALASGANAHPESARGVAAGGNHGCALTLDAGVLCWGANGDGQLGNGTTANASLPLAVSDLASNATAVAAGARHSCALSPAGAVRCWGYNQQGQLGNGNTTSSLVPVAVSGLASGVAAIAAGAYHTCALTTGGGVQCWGLNGSGQLGSDAGTISNVPVAVTGLASGVSAIATGGFHTCALTTGGGVQCWGSNENGQLGDGSGDDSSVPLPVSGFASGGAAIAAGAYHSCAVTTGGGLQCWGANDSGQLGNGTTVGSNVPVAATGLANGVADVSAGGYHSCALMLTGAARCWGLNASGQLGNGTTTSSSVSVAVANATTGVVAIAAGDFHTCALRSFGGVQCWGEGGQGQLGDGASTSSSVPVWVIDAHPDVPMLSAPGLALLTALLGLAGTWGRSGRSARLRRSSSR